MEDNYMIDGKKTVKGDSFFFSLDDILETKNPCDDKEDGVYEISLGTWD